MPYPGLLHPEPLFLWQSTAEPHLLNTVDIQTQFCLRLCGGLWVLVHTKFLWWVWGLILNEILPLLPSCWGFSFALGCGVSFLVGSNILLSMVVQQWVAILEFVQEKMSPRPSTPPSSRPVLTAVYEGFSFSTVSPALVIVCI